MLRLYRHAANEYTLRLRHSKTGSKKRATCFATLLQNELNSDLARSTTQFRTRLATNQVARFVFVGGKKAQHRYSTSFAAMLQNKLHVFCCSFDNRPLALRGHETNVFFINNELESC